MGWLDNDAVARHGEAQLLLWSAFYYLLPALLPHLVESGADVGGLSAAITAAVLVWAVLTPLAGRLVDRGHGLAMMRCGGVLGALLLVAMPIVPAAFLPILIAALGVAMAATLYDPCFAILLRTPYIAASSAITKVTLIAGLATLVTYPAVMLISSAWPWQGVALSFAAVALLGVVAIPDLGAGQPVVTQPERGGVSAGGVLEVALVAVPFGLAMFSHAALLFLLPLALLRLDGGNGWALYLPTVLGPAQIVGRLLWRRYAPAANPKAAACVLFVLLLLPPLLLLAVQAHWVGVLLALLLQGGLYGVHTVLRPLVAAAVWPRDRLGQAIGTIAMIGLLMMAAGPALGGWMWQSVGYDGLIIMLLAVNAAAFGGALILQFAPRGRVAWTRS